MKSYTVHRLSSFVVGTLLAVLVPLFLVGCGAWRGPRITVVWSEAKPAIASESPVRYQSIQVGAVKQVVPSGFGIEVTIALKKKYAHYVRTESTFLVRSGTGAEPAFIEVLPLNPDSAPAVDGARFQGANSEARAQVLAWTTDWKRTAIYIGIGLGLVVLLILAGKILFKLWVLVVCLAGGAAAAAFLTPYIQGPIAQYIPMDARPDLVAYVAAFAAGYLVAAVLLALLRAPFRSSSP
jgi:hypothetical protein